MVKSHTDSGPEPIGFLLVPQFSMMAFSSAVEPLRVANRLAGRPLFAWQAKRAASTEPEGWSPIEPERNGPLNRQY